MADIQELGQYLWRLSISPITPKCQWDKQKQTKGKKHKIYFKMFSTKNLSKNQLQGYCSWPGSWTLKVKDRYPFLSHKLKDVGVGFNCSPSAIKILLVLDSNSNPLNSDPSGYQIQLPKIFRVSNVQWLIPKKKICTSLLKSRVMDTMPTFWGPPQFNRTPDWRARWRMLTSASHNCANPSKPSGATANSSPGSASRLDMLVGTLDFLRGIPFQRKMAAGNGLSWHCSTFFPI